MNPRRTRQRRRQCQKMCDAFPVFTCTPPTSSAFSVSRSGGTLLASEARYTARCNKTSRLGRVTPNPKSLVLPVQERKWSTFFRGVTNQEGNEVRCWKDKFYLATYLRLESRGLVAWYWATLDYVAMRLKLVDVGRRPMHAHGPVRMQKASCIAPLQAHPPFRDALQLTMKSWEWR